ncbi:FG-GAP-like repeat-containing protein [Agromyces cerinus]|nr:FG-GAP-like repeat-containing protein [Agromyces cerinus]
MQETQGGIGRRTLLAGAIAVGAAAMIEQLAAPAALADWPNGQLPASALTWVPGSSGSVPLEKACASAWLSMVAACRQDIGLNMVVTSPDGGYRDLAMQQALIDDPQGPVPIAGLGRSSHGWGSAIDIWARDMDWMRANAGRFGFSQTWSSEPWHWQWGGTPAGVDYEGEKSPRVNVSDFSGDGAADVLGVNAAGNLMYYAHNGSGLSAPVQIGNGWGTFKHVMAADFSGDGKADVLGVNAEGNLMYYPHNGTGLSAPVQIGNGWGAFKHVMAADFSGDGKADVLGVNAEGNLMYYPHNGTGLSAPIQIGNGWGTFKHVMAADFSGDGAADVLGVNAEGNLMYYPHNGTGLSAPIQIGNGWGTFKHVWASDFSGDGKADVLGVNAAGNLMYYPHNGSGLSAPIQIGNGWGSFIHVM